MKKIYVILSKTGTILSHIICATTGEPTPHCSISLDKELYRMYSFGRRTAYDIMNAGLVHERPDKNVFGRLVKTESVIYEIEVTPEQYRRAWEVTKAFWMEKEKYYYNYIGIVLAWIKYYPKVRNSYYCSQFVACVLQEAGIKVTDKDYLAVRPEDFRNSPMLKEIYRGRLQDYWKMVKRPGD